MTLDVSDAKQLVRDFLQMSDDYRVHDPALSSELSSKAHEICRDLGIDVDSLGHEKVIEPSLEKVIEPSLDFLDAATMADHENASEDLEALDDAEALEEQNQLLQILDHQKAVVEAQTDDDTLQIKVKRRSSASGWNMFGSLLRLETA